MGKESPEKNIEEIKVRIDAGEGKISEGTVRLQHFTQQERFGRSLKILAMCWGAAIVSIFLPIVHFFLVPALFLAGLIVPGFVYYKESLILGGEGSCPKCKHPLHIEKGSNQWPLTDLCTDCRSAVTIQKVN